MRTFYAVLIVIGATLFGEAQQSKTVWRVLFDGTSLDAWRGYKTDKVPAGWRMADGSIVKDAPVGDIVSKDEFGDFELELEWKIGEAGNSGIFYRGTEEYDHIYWSAPEYQLLDDIKATDNKTRYTCSGAVYALYASPSGHLKPVGEWNRTRIVAKGPHVGHAPAVECWIHFDLRRHLCCRECLAQLVLGIGLRHVVVGCNAEIHSRL